MSSGAIRAAAAIFVVGVLAVWLVKPIGDACPDVSRLPPGSSSSSSPSFAPPLTRSCTYTTADGTQARRRYVPVVDWLVLAVVAGVTGVGVGLIGPAPPPSERTVRPVRPPQAERSLEPEPTSRPEPEPEPAPRSEPAAGLEHTPKAQRAPRAKLTLRDRRAPNADRERAERPRAKPQPGVASPAAEQRERDAAERERAAAERERARQERAKRRERG